MAYADTAGSSIDREVRDSMMLIRRDRARRLTFAIVALIVAIVGLSALVYVKFNTEMESVKEMTVQPN
ncbi:MAG: hypothetical protein KF718_01815 [Polyangiaceae bacterium]|nr:hypothetical protein [Polyangiaceae bacterium]